MQYGASSIWQVSHCWHTISGSTPWREHGEELCEMHNCLQMEQVGRVWWAVTLLLGPLCSAGVRDSLVEMEWS